VSHKHAYEETRCADIGPDVCLRPFVHSNAPKGMVLNTPESDAFGDHLAGFLIGHERPGFDERCDGAVSIDTCDPARARWTMAGSLEGGDLTLAPSILCKAKTPVWHEPDAEWPKGHYTQEEPTCNFHGFVRGGKWVSA